MVDSHYHNQLISLRDVVSTVEDNLLGAALGDAVSWVRKYLFPLRENYYGRRYSGPRLYVLASAFELKIAKGDILKNLFSMIENYPDFFNELCYDTHCFSVDEINKFFEGLNIKIIFNATNITHVVYGSNSGGDNSNEKDTVPSDNTEYMKVLHLKKYREDDPLALAIEIRNKEWVDFNPDDKNSRVNQDAIILGLTERGLSKKTASSIELVACPIKRS